VILTHTNICNILVILTGKSCFVQSMKELLGGKGSNLAEMSNIGLSVPPGFTITTATCAEYNAASKTLPVTLWTDVMHGIQRIEEQMEMKFGDPSKPLLLSVRSGAAVSMPGMMDTVLNLGLNDEVVEGLAEKAGELFAWDSYRRLLDMFGDVVLGIHHSHFEDELERIKFEAGVENDNELDITSLKKLVTGYKKVYADNGQEFPNDPMLQLEYAIKAVFNSWDSERAVAYRSIQNIDKSLMGTAVTVQSMVFGNLGTSSGTGVLFSRNPSNGDNILYGEYLINAQGEDVVAGIRTPSDISLLEKDIPEAYKELLANVATLETHYKDMQDIEFTIQDKKLFMLQCRSGKRAGKAAVKIAVDLVLEGKISKDEAIMKVEPTHLDQLMHPQFAEVSYADKVLGRGLPASPGAAVGQVVFSAEEAAQMSKKGGKVILVKTDTSPEDVSGMHLAAGILTSRGGMTSHAAVVARGWGKTCVSGVGALDVDGKNQKFSLGGKTFTSGDWISLNGNTGEVIDGKVELTPPTISGDLGIFMEWVDKRRKLDVYTNADSPQDAANARRNGAQGIGLVRTEHMFFSSDERILTVRQMIMADSPAAKQKALDKMLGFQREDFEGIFESMSGLPVTIRLLDPPLHEFLPHPDAVTPELAASLGCSEHQLVDKIHKMHEMNPMMGMRGCRLGITNPEITQMQSRAIVEAALNVKANGIVAQPDIMIPLIGDVSEFVHQRDLIHATAQQVFAERSDTHAFRVGTMIEIPRAALLAEEVAKEADFFSFGTNDLTQMTYGFSRDDVGTFLPIYLQKHILPHDPFQTLDRRGVGKLVKMAVDDGRKAKGSLKIGICGEHGGDPDSIQFVNGIGIDYVSCSPFRVPIARLAAAQAEIQKK